MHIAAIKLYVNLRSSTTRSVIVELQSLKQKTITIQISINLIIEGISARSMHATNAAIGGNFRVQGGSQKKIHVH